MNKQATRTIDELGRIILPKELRQQQGWGTGDEISLSSANDTIVLQLSNRYAGSLCVICDKPESKVRVKGRDICDCCLVSIKNA